MITSSFNKRHLLLVVSLWGLLGLALTDPVAKAQTTSDLLPFTGQWSGVLPGLLVPMSETSVTLDIFENDGLLNATTWFGGVKQNLEYLGFKPSIKGTYFWREADKACICLFFENDRLIMAYFERDSVRRVVLSPQKP